MELSEDNYKETDIGRIPSDWAVRRVEEIASVKGGKRLPKGRSLLSSQTRHPYIRVTDMHPGGVETKGIMYVPEDVAPQIQSYRIYEPDIFISVAGTLGIVGKIPAELDGANLTENADRITNIACDRDYLLANLASNRIQNEIEAARTVGAQPKLALYQIERFAIPIPPTLYEQQAISAALSDVDALLAALDRLIAKKRAVKTATMQQLLTGRQRLPGFSGAWETTTIGEVASIVSGATPRSTVPDYWNGRIAWCTPTDITGTPGKYLAETERTITEAGLASSSAHLLPIGALLLCSRATIGEVKIAAVPIATNQGFKSLVCGPRVNNEFLYYLTLTMKPEMVERATGSTFLEISRKDVAALAISLPARDEQEAIATVLSDMDAEIAALEARRDKTQQMKQGMMQELLTGKTRLVS